MKEKLKYFLEILQTKRSKKIVGILWILFLIWQSYAVYIDMYNFKQLGKAKPILENIPKDAETFYNLKQFNEIYHANIKPIKNCYLVNNYNWKGEYIFWFKLESLIYMYIYWGEYFAYPKYNLPKGRLCFWLNIWGWGGECYDDNRLHFEKVVSNPCKDKEGWFSQEEKKERNVIEALNNNWVIAEWNISTPWN